MVKTPSGTINSNEMSKLKILNLRFITLQQYSTYKLGFHECSVLKNYYKENVYIDGSRP